MAFKSDDDDDIIAEINMTPLIDVMLVLLIIFMVTSSVATDEQLDIRLPETITKTKNDTNQDSTVIYVEKNGTIQINDQKTDFDNLAQDIQKNILEKKSGFILLKGDNNTSLDTIVRIMDLAKNNGATRFGIAVEPKK